jgi:hypothetical protein
MTVKYPITHDALGTHIDWRHDGITPRMIDWFWNNMEKCFDLWHPEQHEALRWATPPRPGNPIGAIHTTPQTWDDGRRQNLYMRFENLADLALEIRDVISLEHVIVAAVLGVGEECLADPKPLGYRIHQWQKTDDGVIGKSSAIGTRKKETLADGRIWALQCVQEIGNWSAFLPQLYTLYKVVSDPPRNPFADLSVEGRGREARYRYLK